LEASVIAPCISAAAPPTGSRDSTATSAVEVVLQGTLLARTGGVQKARWVAFGPPPIGLTRAVATGMTESDSPPIWQQKRLRVTREFDPWPWVAWLLRVQRGDQRSTFGDQPARGSFLGDLFVGSCLSLSYILFRASREFWFRFILSHVGCNFTSFVSLPFKKLPSRFFRARSRCRSAPAPLIFCAAIH
jgi:hypothetical protein